jgi:hypothetical protein
MARKSGLGEINPSEEIEFLQIEEDCRLWIVLKVSDRYLQESNHHTEGLL